MKKNERGALIVEASIVFPVMFLVIIFMLFMGNAYLQKSRIEAIVSKHVLAGAAYCADPQLEQVSNSGVGKLSGQSYPYRFVTSGFGESTASAIRTKIVNDIKGLNTGLFSFMKPEVRTNDVSVKYKSHFIYATFSVDVTYKILIPVRMLGQKDYPKLTMTSHMSVPVSDTTEMIRNVDMIWDYMERTGLAEKVSAVGGKLEEVLGKVNQWFGS